MTTIKRIRTLAHAGILADRTAKDVVPEFRRFNLIYGFNGSGKSTLSKIFARFEDETRVVDLPDGCSFEIELTDGTRLGTASQLAGLESRICVFNNDFIDRNLQWGSGRAKSIFYISEAQADLASELDATERAVTASRHAKAVQDKIVEQREKELKTYRTTRAKTVSNALHLSGRRYEANHLAEDYRSLSYSAASILSHEALAAAIDVTRLSAPPPPLSEIKVDLEAVKAFVENARNFAEVSIGQILLDELDKHPAMAQWISTGYNYHTSQHLESCLFCGNPIEPMRRKNLAAALDNKLATLLSDLNSASNQLSNYKLYLADLRAKWPKSAELDAKLKDSYSEELALFEERFNAARSYLDEAERITAARLSLPMTVVEHNLPPSHVVAQICGDFIEKEKAVNSIIREHNALMADFTTRQATAREAIRLHHLAEEGEIYAGLESAVIEARAESGRLDEENTLRGKKIAELSAKVKSHGPAAEQITKLMKSYLGHGELTVVAANQGYELHRHGKLVRGQPSEGEKTAIALCYFLSTLKSEGRSVKDLIVVVDDPISSLDSKAMTYACLLVRTWLADAAQAFVFTHNQVCMNEFKKSWRNQEKPKNGVPTAIYLFLDVSMPGNGEVRSTNIVDMPAQLKGYDSDYHFLCHKVLQFEAAGEAYSEYWFMMPNVIRRVLEVFLAFKVPGSHPVFQKLESILKRHPELDRTRMLALERVVQVESHSDNIDHLIAQSSITIEETRVANAALLDLMTIVDDNHAAAIRDQCKAA